MFAKKITVHGGDLPSGLSFGDSVAIDTETTGLKLNRDRLCVVQLSAGDGTAHLIHFNKGNYNAPNLKALLEDRKVLKIFHYGRFDIAALKHFLGADIAPVYCTKIASKLARTNSVEHSLKTLCAELLGIEIEKEQQCSDWGAPTLTDEQIKYAANDVFYLHRIKEILDERLIREGRKHFADKCMEFLPTRAALDEAGFEGDVFSRISEV